MMENKRKLIRLEVKDFLEIRPINELGKTVKAETKNFSLMGVCFSSMIEWKKGQVLHIDYFITDELDSVQMKVVVVWSEFIDYEQGYFCGGEIVDIEPEKQEKFANYYFQKLKDKFFD